MEDDKTIHAHARAMYTETRENLKKSMERIAAAIPLEKKDESSDYLSARTVRQSVEKLEQEPLEGDVEVIDECLREAIELKKMLMVKRAECVSSGKPTAAKVFEESILKVSKVIVLYERKKNLGV